LSSIRQFDNQFSGLFEREIDKGWIEERGGRINNDNFMRTYGWIYQASLIAEHERIGLEEVYELKTIQALNDLSYIKSKNAHELEMHKRANGKY
jgi:hypothetical protein